MCIMAGSITLRSWWWTACSALWEVRIWTAGAYAMTMKSTLLFLTKKPHMNWVPCLTMTSWTALCSLRKNIKNAPDGNASSVGSPICSVRSYKPLPLPQTKVYKLFHLLQGRDLSHLQLILHAVKFDRSSSKRTMPVIMRNVTPPSRTVSLTSMENHGLTAGKCFSLRMFHFIIEQR